MSYAPVQDSNRDQKTKKRFRTTYKGLDWVSNAPVILSPMQLDVEYQSDEHHYSSPPQAPRPADSPQVQHLPPSLPALAPIGANGGAVLFNGTAHSVVGTIV